MAKASQQLSFVVTCKGRLQHLRQSLPLMMAQRGTHTIVVDAECPDDTANWVNANQPKATVVRLDNSKVFSLSRARNAGLAAVKTPWVCFIDADIMLARDFWKRIKPLLQPNRFYGFDNTREKFGITGTVIAETQKARLCGGYDEAISGYGGEDYEFYDSLVRLGCTRVLLDDSSVSKVLQHGASERTQHYEQKDIRFTIVVNGFYRVLKKHVRNADAGIDHNLVQRLKIYAEAFRAARLASEAEDQSVELDIPIPPDPIIYEPYAELQQTLKVRLSLKRPKF